MYIPSIDYSPLYRSLQAKRSSELAKYNVKSAGISGKSMALQREAMTLQRESFELGKAQQWTNFGLNLMNNLINVGTQVYGLVSQKNMAEAKTKVIQVQGELEKKRIDMVMNGDYQTYAESKGFFGGDAAFEAGQSDVHSIKLNDDFDQFVQSKTAELTSAYDAFPEVQNYIEQSMAQRAVVEKSAALRDIAKKSIAELSVLDQQNMNSAIDQAIINEDPSIFKAQIKSANWKSPQQKKIDMNIAMDKYTDGIRRKDIKNVMHESGYEAAFDEIERMELTDDKKVQYKAYASNLYEAEQNQYAAEIAQKAQEWQRKGISNYDIAEKISRDENIPPAYREMHEQSYRYAADMEHIDNLVKRQGPNAAAVFVGSDDRHYTPGEKDAAMERVAIATDQATSFYADQWSKLSADTINQSGNPELAYQQLDQAIEREDMPKEFRPAAEQAIRANHRTFLDNSFESRFGTYRYNLPDLKTYRDEIHKDHLGKYDRMPALRVDHLERLDKQIEDMQDTAPTGDKTAAERASTFMTDMYAALANEAVSVADVWRTVTDPDQPIYQDFQALGEAKYKNFLDYLRNQVMEGNPRGELITAKIKSMDDYLENLKKSSGFTDADVNELRVGLQRQMVNAVQADPDIPTGQLNEIFDRYLELSAGKTFDIYNADVRDKKGNQVGMSRNQLWEMQREIDKADEAETGELTVGLQGNVNIPAYLQDNFNFLGEHGRNLISSALQAQQSDIHLMGGAWTGDPNRVLQGFKPLPGERVSVQPIYTFNGRNFIMHAGKKRGEFEVYEIMPDGSYSRMELIDPEDRPPLVPFIPRTEQQRGAGVPEGAHGWRGIR